MNSNTRYKLTQNPKRFGYIAIVVGAFIAFDGIYSLLKNGYSSGILVKLAFGAAVGIIPFQISKSRSFLQFDKNFLYITSGNSEKSILLRNIFRVSKSSYMNDETNQRIWHIKYRDLDGGTRSLEIPVSGSSSIKKFLQNIKSENPQVEIED